MEIEASLMPNSRTAMYTIIIISCIEWRIHHHQQQKKEKKTHKTENIFGRKACAKNAFRNYFVRLIYSLLITSAASQNIPSAFF